MGWQEGPDNLRETSSSEEAGPSFPVFLTPFAAVRRENWTSRRCLEHVAVVRRPPATVHGVKGSAPLSTRQEDPAVSLD